MPRAVCSRQDCSKEARYGERGTGKPLFCAGHSEEGMVFVERRKGCAQQGCTKRSSFDVAGSKSREFCAGHAKQGMVDLNNKKRCAQQGCTKRPSFGVAGSKKSGEFCAGHAEQGMVRLIRNCAQQGCTKVPAFGVGREKREFCAGHAKQGMTDVRGRQEGRSSSTANSDSATALIHSGLPMTLPAAGGGAGSVRTVHRPASNQQRKSSTRLSAPRSDGRSNTTGKDRLKKPAQSSDSQAGQSRLPVAAPAGRDEGQHQDQDQGAVQDSSTAEGIYSPSPNLPEGDDCITTTTTVKTEEEVALSSAVLVSDRGSAREDDTVGHHSGGSGRGGKRKGSALSSSTQTSTGGDDAEWGKRSRQSRGRKRARAGGDNDDVTFVEAGHEGLAAAGTAGGSGAAGARVAIKDER